MAAKLEEIPLLSQKRCHLITAEVLGLSPFWMNRNGFYTLGAATYQDDPLTYPTIANLYNPILIRFFSRLYETVAHFLQTQLKTDVSMINHRLGMAGFHIFDSQTANMMGHPHIDEPYTRVDLTPFGEWSDPFSFTLPVSLPACGGGMDMWHEFTDKDIDNFIGSDTLPTAVYEPYKLGHVYIHDGKTPHRIANPAPIQDGEFRITLQGHGVMTGQGAVIYF